MGFFKPLHELCDPAKLYLVISFVSIVASLMTSNLLGISLHAVSVLLWAFVLGWLCDRGYPGVSWFLVLALPVLMLVILIIGTVFILSRPADERSDLLRKISKEKTDEGKSPEDEKEKRDDSSKEGMGGMKRETLEKMSIRTPQDLSRAVNGMMNMNKESFSNSSSINEAFGPIL